jgi:MFS family permease
MVVSSDAPRPSAPQAKHPSEHKRHGGVAAGETSVRALSLLRIPALRRLIGIRIFSSLGDGAFQGALVSAVFFNPTRESSAAAIAAAFAVLLLPYSVIGPFAGALLDRWSRRSVIIVATLMRAVLVLGVASMLAAGAPSWVLLVGALLVTGAARFVGSGMSAALPHTVPTGALVPANALAVTCGSIAAAAGGGYAILMRDLIGVTNGPIAVVTATVPVFYLVAVVLTAGFSHGALGPDATDEPTQPVRAVLAGFSSALRHAVQRPTVGVSVVLVVTVRFCFGMATLVILLLYQHHFTARVGPLLPGLNGIAEVLAAISVGLLAGAVATPVLVRMFGRTATILGLMIAASVTAAVCGPRFSLVAIFVAAPVLAFTYQAVKVCVDSIVQSDADDAYVGRVFALYDTANNVFYVGAFAVGALVVPFDGRSVALIVVMAVVYAAAGIVYAAVARRLRRAHEAALAGAHPAGRPAAHPAAHTAAHRTERPTGYPGALPAAGTPAGDAADKHSAR